MGWVSSLLLVSREVTCQSGKMVCVTILLSTWLDLEPTKRQAIGQHPVKDWLSLLGYRKWENVLPTHWPLLLSSQAKERSEEKTFLFDHFSSTSRLSSYTPLHSFPDIPSFSQLQHGLETTVSLRILQTLSTSFADWVSPMSSMLGYQDSLVHANLMNSPWICSHSSYSLPLESPDSHNQWASCPNEDSCVHATKGQHRQVHLRSTLFIIPSHRISSRIFLSFPLLSQFP